MKFAKRNRSKYVKNLPKGAIVSLAEGAKAEVAIVETILTPLTQKLLVELLQATQVARELGVQRQESPERRNRFKDKIVQDSPPTLEHFNIELVSYEEPNRPRKLLDVDAAHKTTAASDAFNEGYCNTSATITIRRATDEQAMREWAAVHDPRNAARTPYDLMNTTFGVEETHLRGQHILKLNTANANIKAGCPEKDLSRLAECDPYFPRMTILSYPNLKYIRYQDADTLNWFYNSFPLRGMNDPRGKFLPAGVATAVILSYKLALLHGEDIGTVKSIWQNYIRGEFPIDSGYKGLVELRDYILSGNVAGTVRGQNDVFQRAVYGYNMVKNYATMGTNNKYVDGARYQIDKGMIKPLLPKNGKTVKVKATKVRKAA